MATPAKKTIFIKRLEKRLLGLFFLQKHYKIRRKLTNSNAQIKTVFQDTIQRFTLLTIPLTLSSTLPLSPYFKKGLFSKKAQRKLKRWLHTFLITCISISTQQILALPQGAEVIQGQASMNQSTPSALQINQSTNQAIINWNTFNIAKEESVTFKQPNAQSIMLNRVTGANASEIYGKLNANGQLFLINPQGILFGKTAQVDVGSLTASTLNLSNSDFLAKHYTFKQGEQTGTVKNEGQITTSEGGYIALISSSVTNEGTITANKGTVALAAGEEITVTLADSSFLDLKVTKGSLDAAIANRNLIQADNGQVYMATKGREAMVAGVINNTGIIRAQRASNEGGVIKLIAEGGTIYVGGTLDASAPKSGDGGFIETSGDHAHFDSALSVKTVAAHGKTGEWLIDPTDYTIASSGGDITGTALGTALNSSNITIQTASTGAGNGDILVNDAVSWSSTNSLTLNAHRHVVVNQDITNSSTGGITARADLLGNCVSGASNCGTISFASTKKLTTAAGGAITLYYNPTGSNGSADANGNIANAYTTPTSYTTNAAGGTLTAYMLVNDVNQLQSTKTNLTTTGIYALGKNINAATTSTWNSGLGFDPIGNNSSGTSTTRFVGKFNGQNNTITGLTINRPTTDYVGLFGYIGKTGTSANIQNIGLINASISGQTKVGGLVGNSANGSNISNAYVTGSVTTGGLIGGVSTAAGTISNSYSTATVTGTGSVANIGGLIGQNNSLIINSYAIGNVTGASSGNSVGGLVGDNQSTITNSYATGTVSSSSGQNIGGLVGYNNTGGLITGASYSTGSVSANASNSGGLVGNNATASSVITGGSYSISTVTNTGNTAGGLVGTNSGTISNAYAKGTVSGLSTIGGLVGINSGTITSVFSTGNATGTTKVGALVGQNATAGNINNAYAAGSATGTIAGASQVGALVGYNVSTITNSYATGNASATSSNINNEIGGLVGENNGGTINYSYSTGSVSAGAGNLGGLVGVQTGASPSTTNSYWDTTTSGQAASAAGTGQTTSQLLSQATYSGWDFTNTWYSSDTNTRPILRSEYSTSITNSHQLQLINTALSASYTLANNIDMSVLSQARDVWGAASTGFVPIGTFTGSLNGQNFTISNLNINRPSTNSVGLFGTLGGSASVSNLGLINSVISGQSNVGALAGFNNGSGTISNVYSTGTISATNNYAGGLVGVLDNSSALISNSYSSASITGNTASGGLIGQLFGGTAANSYASGTVITTSDNPGGLVGENRGTITSSYATGNVSSTSGWTVGGLVGSNNGGIIKGASYATGNVTGTGNNVGGLAGSNSGTISESSYATGSVSAGGSVAGGLVGNNASTGIITNTYATGNATANSDGAAGLVGDNSGTISSSYATGSVTSSNGWNSGGLVGINNSTGVITGSYAIGSASGNLANSQKIGGLAGANSGSISTSYASGSVAGYSSIGGLVGNNTGNITASYATGNVTATSDASGGLVGINDNTISNSYATGSVNSTGGWSIGGLVGINSSTGLINLGSYATGSVSGNTSNSQRLGGLTGSNDGTIANSYATGNVSGYSSVGGLTGTQSGTVNYAYATGNVTGNNTVGGLAGYNNGLINTGYSTGSITGSTQTGGLVGNNAGTVSASYWDTTTSGQSSSSGGTAKTTSQLLSQASYSGWDFSTIWYSSDTNTRPILRSELSTTIKNAHQLQLINASLGSNYTLATNIDMSVLTNTNDVWAGASTGFVPIGNATTQFSGVFDGLGNIISGLKISRSSTNNVGLFGYISNATVKNVGLTNVNIMGQGNVGGVVGQGINNSTIADSYSTGLVSGNSANVGGVVGVGGSITNLIRLFSSANVSGSSNNVGGVVGYNRYLLTSSYSTGTISSSGLYVGGLVGYNQSTISNSYATGSVSGNDSVGGLVGYMSAGSISSSYAAGVVSASGGNVGGLIGYNNGNISNSYATGNVIGTGNNVGGLAGQNLASISQSYSTGSVSGATDIGGLVGLSSSGTVTSSYWDTSTSGQATSAGGTGKTTAQLLSQATYSGWNFSTTWYSSDTFTRPILRSEYSTSISNLHQLQLMNTALGASYTLANNISASELSQAKGIWATTTGFVPIGTSASPFTGILDGQNYTINNLTINRSSDNIGLFGYISAATVKNVSLTNATITGQNQVGALVGQSASSSTITNTSSTGAITGNTTIGGLVGTTSSATVITNTYSTANTTSTNSTGQSYVGGLIGNNTGTVTSSYSKTGSVTATAGDAGGLIGWSSGSVTNSYSTENITTAGTNVGGLIGFNSTTGFISNTYATGSVTNTQNITGGLVGYNSGSISSSYASNTVNSASYVGGFVGGSGGTITSSYATGNVIGTGSNIGGFAGQNIASISNVYSTGSVTGSSAVGGLIGLNSSGTVSGSYWDTTTSGQATSAAGTGKTTAQLLSQATYSGWDFSNTWYSSDTNTRPILRSEYSTSIINPHQLQLINTNLSASYTLANNIDLSALSNSKDVWGGASTGFVPIGTNASPFTGSLNGNNYTISGLSINRSSTDYIGLFGKTNGATIQNIGLISGAITGRQYVGALVGLNSGTDTITNTYATGSVIGNNANTGGLIGSNAGTINSSYATNSVAGTFYVGGLVGSNAGLITSSYATGTVSASNTHSGGLAGANTSTISASYSTGSVTGNGDVGGLVGTHSGLITTSYATGAVTGQTVVNTGGLVGLTSSSGTVSYSYASGSVTSSMNYTGGLIGYSAGNTNNVYAIGNVSGTDYVGGLVGGNGGTGIQYAYATGSVSGNGAHLGGLTAINNTAVSNSYWNTQTSGQASSAGGTGKTTSETMTQSTFSGWDFTNTWGITPGVSYPYLKSLFGSGVQVVSGTLSGVSSAAGIKPVTLSSNGTVIANLAGTGANGFYYFLLPSASLSNGNVLLSYINDGGTTLATNMRVSDGSNSTNMALDANTLRVSGTTASLANLTTAKGVLNSSSIPYSVSGGNVTTSSGASFVTGAGTAFTLNGNLQATGGITIGDTLALTANSTLDSGNSALAINGATSGAYNLHLNSTGNITQSAAISVSGLELTGTGGNAQLTNASNNFSTLAANIGTLNIVDNASLAIGTVGSTSGIITANSTFIKATGATSDITLNQGITNSAGSGLTITLVAARNFINNVGSSVLSAGSGNKWNVYSSTPTSDTRGGLAYNFKQYNASYGSSVLGTGNGFLYSVAPSLTVSLAGTVSKIYDSNTSTTLSGSNYSLSGVLDSDTVNITNSSVTYDNKNAGSSKTVTATGLSINSATNSGATVYGYALSSTTANNTIGSITAKALTISGASASNKVYDGDTSASVSG
ncbi:MAG: GLUG motif-containing protein, partial [Pseudomonadota bacterium]